MSKLEVLVYLIISILGSALITLLNYLFSGSVADSVSSVVLWFTAVIVLAYTIETSKLRKVATGQLAISSKSLQNEVLPLVALIPQCLVQGNRVHIVIKNIGKGPARNIKINIEGNAIYEGVSLLPGDSRTYDDANGYEDAIEAMTSDTTRTEINASITYYDIYERRIDINGILFRKDGDSRPRFVMDQGTGKFLFYD